MKTKRSNQIKTLIIFTLILSVVSVGAITFMIAKTYFGMNRTNSGINGTYENEFYSLRNNATEYQKTLYKSLNEALVNEDDVTTATLVAQNFIADFYTFSNKISINDVGGLQYLDPTMETWVYQLATDTLYNNIPSYQAEDVLKNSLTVISSEANGEVSTQTMNGTQVNGYLVTIEWKYETELSIDTSQFETKSEIFVVKAENGRFNIVKITGEQSIQNNGSEDLGDE